LCILPPAAVVSSNSRVRKELETDRVDCGKLDLGHPKWRLTIDSKAGEAPPDIGCLFQSMMNLPLSPGLNRPTPLSRIRHGDFSIMPTCAVISRPKSDASLLEHLNGHSERLCAGRPGLLNPLSE
jgi:hypothetical protein